MKQRIISLLLVLCLLAALVPAVYAENGGDEPDVVQIPTLTQEIGTEGDWFTADVQSHADSSPLEFESEAAQIRADLAEDPTRVAPDLPEDGSPSPFEDELDRALVGEIDPPALNGSPLLQTATDGPNVEAIADAYLAFCDGYEGTYTTVTANDSNALSIGVIQWHGERARKLLKRIIDANPAKMSSLLSPALYNEIQNSTNWNSRTLSKYASGGYPSEVAQIGAVLGTPEGVKIQIDQAQADILYSVTTGLNYGVRTDAALFYYCSIDNAYGSYGANKYVITPVKNYLGSDTINCLEDFHRAVLASTNKNYFSYRTATYNYIKALGWNGWGEQDWSSDARPSRIFTDVKAKSWYRTAVDFALENKLFNGTSPTTFSPDDTMTRSMLVTVLYRMAGSPAVSGTTRFTDVKSGKFYTKAVLWASQKGIVEGVSDTMFDPDGFITREQLAVVLYRYATVFKKLYTAPNNTEAYGYSDSDQISGYAKKAMLWAIQNGIITGSGSIESGYCLYPKGQASRAEVATILMRYVKNALASR